MAEPKRAASGPAQRADGARFVIVEARFYDAIGDHLLNGAKAALEAAGAEYEVVGVPGALEIPAAGAIALGCVIRGETAHYDIVVNNANHWFMDVAVRHDVPVGNAILTVETEAQAIARAEGGRKGKGGDAARACLSLIEIKRAFWGQKA